MCEGSGHFIMYGGRVCVHLIICGGPTYYMMGGGCVMCVPMKCGGRWLCDVCAYEVWWEVVV